jgi:hypothetical protein
MKRIAAMIVGPLLVGTLAVPAHAAGDTFYDERGDVRAWVDQEPAYVNQGIDIHSLRVGFNRRALLLTSKHKNLSPANTERAGEHGFLLDTNPANRGPEWVVQYVGSEIDTWHAGRAYLFKVDNYRQANKPTRKMARTCGATLQFDVWRETVRGRIPVRCFPKQVKRVRVYQSVAHNDWEFSTYDYLLGRRKYTDWVRKG